MSTTVYGETTGGAEDETVRERTAVDLLRAQALSAIEDMVSAIVQRRDARSACEATSPATVNEALVAQVMRIAASLFAEARGLSLGGGRLLDDELFPLLQDPAFRRAIAPATTRAQAALRGDESSPDRSRIAFDQLSIEVLGSLYEGLIQHAVVVDSTNGFALRRSARRKRSGSYFTPRRITREVVARALAPAVDRVQALPPSERAPALLSLRCCDPAMGAGAFLIETARQLAREVARAESCGTASTASDTVLKVVTECLYGCDTSVVAVSVAEASLWILVADQTLPVDLVGNQLQVGDALIGMLREDLQRRSMVPVDHLQLGLFATTDPPPAAAVHRHRCPARTRRAADHVVGSTLARLGASRSGIAPAEPDTDAAAIAGGRDVVPDYAIVAREHQAFHWPLAFAPAATAKGFDVVVGNPPWVAYAGRAAQPLAPTVRAYFAQCYEAWRGYPTLHGLFVERAARLAPNGVVALVVPSPLADLDGYRGVRRALSRRHRVREPMLEFGQDAFEDVVQPCIALVADPTSTPDPTDRPWQLEERQRAAGVAASVTPPAVLERIESGPILPSEAFREMGFQTTAVVTSCLLLRAPQPDDEHRVPLLEGRNVREFFVGQPQLFLASDKARLHAAGARLRPLHQYTDVSFVVRQTASVPIAAQHTGLPFRNTLLAGFALPDLSTALLVGLLNSALYRALHLAARRDARQAAFPQVKVAHLRRLPLPPARSAERHRIATLSTALRESAAVTGHAALGLRNELDEAVFDLFEVSVDQRHSVRAFLVDRAGNLRYRVE